MWRTRMAFMVLEVIGCTLAWKYLILVSHESRDNMLVLALVGDVVTSWIMALHAYVGNIKYDFVSDKSGAYR